MVTYSYMQVICSGQQTISIMGKVIQVYNNVTPEFFRVNVYGKRQPAILRGVDIGECIHKWTSEYLSHNVENLEVKVHVSESPLMDFINKNFLYKTLSFKELILRAAGKKSSDFFISSNEYYYLRSLGFDRRNKDVADIKKQFPTLSDDIKIPEFFDSSEFFSSVFRIGSAGVQLWTHYDIMDNLLIQVRGRKRLSFFAPSDAQNIYLIGDKSEVLDIDNVDFERFPRFLRAERYDCILKEGDIMFIPALWFHNALAMDFSVAVNVFWKNLKPELYDKNDVYGNKDLVPATRALQMTENAVKLLDTLPHDYKDFYIRRMIVALESKISPNKT